MMPTLPPIVWKILGALAALLVVAAGAYYEGHHREALVFQQYKDKQAAAVGQQVGHNQTAVAAITASEAAGLRQIAASAQESRNEIQKRNDALVGSNAALAATVGQLRTRLASTGRQTVVVPAPAAGGPVADAASDSPLPDGLADLVKFNARQFRLADDDTVTISALQATVAQDREICNGSLPGIGNEDARAVPAEPADPH